MKAGMIISSPKVSKKTIDLIFSNEISYYSNKFEIEDICDLDDEWDLKNHILKLLGLQEWATLEDVNEAMKDFFK